MEKRNIKKSTFLKLCRGIAIILLIITISCSGNGEGSAEHNIQSSQTENVEVIDYTVLRDWNPDEDPRAVGLDILITEDDATQYNIEILIRSLSSNTNKAVIKVFQDRQAWQEEQSGNFTDAYDSGYLAFYVKNETSSGAYRGFNEIRWFQAEGQLEHLMGTNTQL